MNKVKKINRKGYEIIQPSILGGLKFWSTDIKLVNFVENVWRRTVNLLSEAKK